MSKRYTTALGAIAAGLIWSATASSAAATDLVALTGDRTLLLIDGGRPEVKRQINVTGIGGQLLGIDVRPADGHLYGLVSDGTVVTIARNGKATFKSRLNPPILFPLNPRASVDFNPAADRLRIIFSDGQNLRANVDTGELLIDTPLNYAPNPFVPVTTPLPAPQVIAAAYTNSAVGTAPASKGTLLFDIDDLTAALFAQVPANGGTLNAVGGLLGIDPSQIGFDIATDRSGRNTALLINGRRLYKVDLISGSAGRSVRVEGLRAQVRDLAALPSR